MGDVPRPHPSLLKREKIHIVQVTHSSLIPQNNWLENSVLALFQPAPKYLEGISNRVLEGEDLVLKVQVEWGKAKCFKCGRKEHVTAECWLRKGKDNPLSKNKNI